MSEPISDTRYADIRRNLAQSKKLLSPTQFAQGYEQDVEDLLAEVERLRAANAKAIAALDAIDRIQVVSYPDDDYETHLAHLNEIERIVRQTLKEIR